MEMLLEFSLSLSFSHSVLNLSANPGGSLKYIQNVPTYHLHSCYPGPGQQELLTHLPPFIYPCSHSAYSQHSTRSDPIKTLSQIVLKVKFLAMAHKAPGALAIATYLT